MPPPTSADGDDNVRPVRTPAAARWTTLVLTVIALLLLALILGPVGLLAGPLIISSFLAVIRMWDRSEAETA